MNRSRRAAIGCALLCLVAALSPAVIAQDKPPADPRAAQIAGEVMQALGGSSAWENTRYVAWRFFGRRMHYWDKWTGDVRIEADGKLVLMNIHSKKGRAWEDGVEVTHADSLAPRLEKGFGWWTNDSYWVFMPFKLRDPGVQLRYLGERTMQDGRAADVLELTFSGVGLTPQNKYEVCVDKETHLVGEWTYYRNASDAEPAFTRPWKDWKRVGGLMLCGDHGGDPVDWELAVYDELPRSVFTSPEAVALR